MKFNLDFSFRVRGPDFISRENQFTKLRFAILKSFGQNIIMTLYQVDCKQGNTDQGEEKLVEIDAQVSRKIGDLIILCPEIIYHNVAMNSLMKYF